MIEGKIDLAKPLTMLNVRTFGQVHYRKSTTELRLRLKPIVFRIGPRSYKNLGKWSRLSWSTFIPV